jgi:hypothetical protein
VAEFRQAEYLPHHALQNVEAGVLAQVVSPAHSEFERTPPDVSHVYGCCASLCWSMPRWNSPGSGLRMGIIPYVEIPLTKHCLAEIWQGPTLDYDLTERTLEMYLMRTYGVHPNSESVVRVRRSEIPLRKLDA